MANDTDILNEAKEAYRLGLDADRDNRDSYLEDYRFARMDEQWPEDIQTQRQRDGKPCLTINRLMPFIHQVINDARQNRPRITTKPADDFADPKTANVIDGLIYHIEQSSNASVAYDTAIDCAVSGGFGYMRVDIEYANTMSFDKCLKINRIGNPLQVVADPYSQAADSSDWNTCFVTDLMQKDEFEKRYKGAAGSSWFETDYRGMDQQWMDGDEIMLAEWWKRDEVEKTLLKLSDGRTMLLDVYEQQAEYLMSMGVMPVNERKTPGFDVVQHLLTGAEVLKTTKWAGQYIPIVPVYGEELNIEGKRVYRSLIHRAKDAQRRYNYWASIATEIVGLSPKTPYFVEERVVEVEPEKWETVNSKSWPYIAIPNGSPPPQRQPMDGGQAVGAISQAMAAADEIKAITGMYDASLGQRSNETSGRAILARQKEGDTGTFHFADNLSRAHRHLGIILVDLIPTVYPPDSVVRIVGQDGREAQATIGQRDPSQPPPETSPLDPVDDMGTQPDEGMEQLQPGINEVYDVGLGRYDVVVASGPSYNTKREQSADQMIQFVQAYPPAAPIIGDLLVKAMDWPDAEEAGRRLKAMLPPQAGNGPPPEVQQMQQQMEQMQQDSQQQMQQMQEQAGQQAQQMQEQIQTLEQEKIRLTAEKQMAEQKIQIDHMKLQIEQFKAETDRMQAQQAIMAAQQPMQQPQAPSPVSISMPEQIGTALAENMALTIAPIIAQTVAQAMSNIPPLQVNQPRMRRIPIRDQSGMIIETRDEPIMDEVVN